MIKLKDVKSLMVDIQDDCITPEGKYGFVKAIDIMSEKSIGLNREKLAKTLFNYVYPYHDWECRYEYQKKSFYKEAETIISEEHNIIEFCPAETEKESKYAPR